ncbi:MAG: RNA polymerase sigma factor [Acidimicrobiales bacterium]
MTPSPSPAATLAPFEAVVRAESQLVWRVCRALLSAADAEDAWAETFLAALRAYPDLPPGSNVRGWLVTIAHRKALDQLRAARRRPEPRADPTADPRQRNEPPATRPYSGADQALDQLEDDELRARVAALPDKARRAVIYRYLADLPYAEVAALLGVSPAAARRNAADGIARLRRPPPLPAPALPAE